MARTEEEIKAAVELRQKFKENGLHRAIEIMTPVERSYARRTICHALEDFASPHDVYHYAWDEALEAAAKILDAAAQDWNRIRDPGMANNARSYAKKVRALRRGAS